MPATMSHFARLRRPALGAWLAVVYALAALAAALAPAQPAIGHPAPAMAALCSGAAAPADPAPSPSGGALHCEGCPAGSLMAAPPEARLPAILRQAALVSPAKPRRTEPAYLASTGLPQARAPPFGAA